METTMKAHMTLLASAVLILFTGSALAQATQDHQQHHPGGSAPQVQPAPAQPPATLPHAAPPAGPQSQMPMGQMMQGMPEQCRGMMQNMQSCMGMMHQMMQGRMGQGGMPGHMGHSGMQTTPAQPTAVSSASTKAYLEAAEKMHAPMMQGMQAQDPDAAFVRGMIPHHQGAIDMAKVVLQYGKDPQVKKWANDVIREQQREIGEMEEWLKKNAR
jgi:uncharacterized protein (DUF305 family)